MQGGTSLHLAKVKARQLSCRTVRIAFNSWLKTWPLRHNLTQVWIAPQTIPTPRLYDYGYCLDSRYEKKSLFILCWSVLDQCLAVVVYLVISCNSRPSRVANLSGRNCLLISCGAHVPLLQNNKNKTMQKNKTKTQKCTTRSITWKSSNKSRSNTMDILGGWNFCSKHRIQI